MKRTYKVDGAVETTTPFSRDITFELGLQTTQDAEVSGVVSVAGTNLAPQSLDFSRVPSVKLLLLRVLTGGPFTILVTSTSGSQQAVPFDDLWFSNLKSSGDAITKVELVGSGQIEFLAAGATQGSSPGSFTTPFMYLARAACLANVADLSAFAVASSDALTPLVQGDIVFLLSQDTKTQNGLWVVGPVSGGNAPLSRPTLWNTGMVIPSGAIIVVQEGASTKTTAPETSRGQFFATVMRAGGVTVDVTAWDPEAYPVLEADFFFPSSYYLSNDAFRGASQIGVQDTGGFFSVDPNTGNAYKTVEYSLQQLGAVKSAGWSLAPGMLRFILLSYDNGNDANPGFVDAAAGTDLSALVSTIAVKTWERVLQLLPFLGCGRRVEIIVEKRAGGATYKDTSGTTDADVLLRAVGYAFLNVRGTGTDSTAGSVAFKNDANDHQYSGARLLSGFNAPGYKVTFSTKNVVSVSISGTTVTVEVTAHGYTTNDVVLIRGTQADSCADGVQTLTVTDANHFTLNNVQGLNPGVSLGAFGTVKRWKCTKADGSAPGWTHESSSTLLLARRMRFDVGSGLANQCFDVWANGVDTLVPTDDFTSAGADVFYFEEAGAAFRRVSIQHAATLQGFSSASTTIVATLGRTQLLGLRAINSIAMLGNGTVATMAFCQAPALTATNLDAFNASRTPLFQGAGAQTAAVTTASVGGNRIGDETGALSSNVSISNCGSVSWLGGGYTGPPSPAPATANFNVFSCNRIALWGACVNTRGLQFQYIGYGAGSPVRDGVTGASQIGNGTSATTRMMRVMGTAEQDQRYGLVLQSCSAALFGIDFGGFPTSSLLSAIAISGVGNKLYADSIYGTSGNFIIDFGPYVLGGSFASRENTVICGTTFYARGACGAVGLKCRPGSLWQGMVEWKQIIEQFGFIRDGADNMIGPSNAGPSGIESWKGGIIDGFTVGSAPSLPQYRVYRLGPNATYQYEAAQADASSPAQSFNIAGISTTQSPQRASALFSEGILISRGGDSPLEFDPAGANPVVGNEAWLSPNAGGYGQIGPPAASGTVQAIYLGRVIRELGGKLAIVRQESMPRSVTPVSVIAADPAAPLDGTMWVTDVGGVRNLCVQVAGTTRRTLLT